MAITGNIINNIEDIKQGFSVIEENDKNSPFFLTNKEKESLVILRYEKEKIKSNKDQILLIIDTNAIKEFQRKIMSIKSFSSEKECNFGYKKINSKNKVLIKGLYQISNENNYNLKKSSEKNDITEIVESIFLRGLKLGTSDIHLEKRKDKTLLKMRVNGELSRIDAYLSDQGDQIAKIIYQVFASEGGGESDTSFDPKRCQNGLVDKVFDGQRVRVRIATAPANPVGFDMVCRLLPFDEDAKSVPLDVLGYSAKEKSEVDIMKSKAIGAVIVAGVTGSGKSTTLKNILISKLSDTEGNIKCITIEDPPEYFIPGATQIPVNREVEGEEAFERAIKAAMRMDPDIIMVGEVRDIATGSLLRSAVESGHQVFTTVHASSAFGIIGRLENLGIPRETLASPTFISGLIYQKLLPKLCTKCSVGIKGDKIPRRFPFDKILLDNIETFKINIETITEVKKSLEEGENLIRKLQDLNYLNSKQAQRVFDIYNDINDEIKNAEFLERIKSVCDIKDSKVRFRGQGCSNCNSGIAGRIVCAETVIPDLELLRLLSEGSDADAINYWKIQLKGKFAMEDAIDKMKLGIVDPYDIEHSFQKLNIKKQ